jgi:hypothetical protein
VRPVKTVRIMADATECGNTKIVRQALHNPLWIGIPTDKTYDWQSAREADP